MFSLKESEQAFNSIKHNFFFEEGFNRIYASYYDSHSLAGKAIKGAILGVYDQSTNSYSGLALSQLAPAFSAYKAHKQASQIEKLVTSKEEFSAKEIKALFINPSNKDILKETEWPTFKQYITKNKALLSELVVLGAYSMGRAIKYTIQELPTITDKLIL